MHPTSITPPGPDGVSSRPPPGSFEAQSPMYFRSAFVRTPDKRVVVFEEFGHRSGEFFGAAEAVALGNGVRCMPQVALGVMLAVLGLEDLRLCDEDGGIRLVPRQPMPALSATAG